MKARRYRYKLLAFLLSLLFIILALYGIYSIRRYGNRWFSSPDNPRLAELMSSVTPGSIADRSGVILASTVDGRRLYQSDIRARSAVVHLLGDRDGRITDGVEQFHAGYLYGYRSSLHDAVLRLTRKNDTRMGNDIVLTVDSKLCTAIPDFFLSHTATAGKNGAVAVVNYLTGEIVASVSLPVFDPDNPDDSVPETAFRNKVTQMLYPAGGLTVLIKAACISGKDGGDSDAYTDIVSLAACAEPDANSLRAAAGAFCFDRSFPQKDLVITGSVYSGSSGSAMVTPIHMALLAASVAKGGSMPEPLLIQRVSSADGGNIYTSAPAELCTVCAPAVADRLRSVMRNAVLYGDNASDAAVTTMDICGLTAVAAADPDSVSSCCSWFIGFNAQYDLPFAVCVLTEGSDGSGTGNSTAALIAKDIFTYLRNHPYPND